MDSYAIIAIILTILALLIIGGQYLWLFALAHEEEEYAKKYDEANKNITRIFETIIYYSTEDELEIELKALKDYVGEDKLRIDILSTKIIDMFQNDNVSDEERGISFRVLKYVEIIEFYKKLLDKGDFYEKSFACRKLALFDVEQQIPQIRKYIKSQNKELSYNAAMALSAFGDKESIVDFILSCEKNFSYSHRIILEIMDNYMGDLAALSKEVFEKCDDYIKSTVIKGLAGKDYPEFEIMYVQGLSSKNPSIKIACAKALARTGKPEYEFPLIVAANDKNWVVRSNVVKQLGQFNSQQSINALIEATKDKEWWVRYSAAKALVDLDINLEYIEQVLGGYDKYASDAVKFALYKKYQINENEEEK